MIVTHVTVSNSRDDAKSISFDARVDTGSTFLTLPSIWREKLGVLETLESDMHLVRGKTCPGEVCGPVYIKMENFREISGEVLFIEMERDDIEDYEPLIGYLPLEAIPAGVDILNQRLFKKRVRV